jgi:hypothetical protein
LTSASATERVFVLALSKFVAVAKFGSHAAADAPAGMQAAPATAITAAASARRPVARREPARVVRPARGAIVPAVIASPSRVLLKALVLCARAITASSRRPST